MKSIKAIKEQAEELYNHFELKKFDNGLSRVIINEGPKRQDAVDLTFKVKESTNLSDDSVYNFTQQALSTISDSEVGNLDELEELRYEIEADVYTSDLTEWLNESNHHVVYLSEAIEDGATEGFNALTMAQAKAKAEVFDIVLQFLQN